MFKIFNLEKKANHGSFKTQSFVDSRYSLSIAEKEVVKQHSIEKDELITVNNKFAVISKNTIEVSGIILGDDARHHGFKARIKY